MGQADGNRHPVTLLCQAVPADLGSADRKVALHRTSPVGFVRPTCPTGIMCEVLARNDRRDRRIAVTSGGEPSLGAGYLHAKSTDVVVPRITGPMKPLKLAGDGIPIIRHPRRPLPLGNGCRLQDSNLRPPHYEGLSGGARSRGFLRVLTLLGGGFDLRPTPAPTRADSATPPLPSGGALTAKIGETRPALYLRTGLPTRPSHRWPRGKWDRRRGCASLLDRGASGPRLRGHLERYAPRWPNRARSAPWPVEKPFRAKGLPHPTTGSRSETRDGRYAKPLYYGLVHGPTLRNQHPLLGFERRLHSFVDRQFAALARRSRFTADAAPCIGISLSSLDAKSAR